MGECKKLIKLNLQNNGEDFNDDIPDAVNNLPNLTRIHVKSGIEIKGKLLEDANAAKKIWALLGGLEGTLTKQNGKDIYKWEGVEIEKGRVTKLGAFWGIEGKACTYY